MNSDYMKKRYGMEMLTLAEELALPDAVREKRNAKVDMIDRIDIMASDLKSLQEIVKNIPENDDPGHLDRVNALREKTRHLQTELNMVYTAIYKEQ